jgi:predicted GNAT family acetyltransferase
MTTANVRDNTETSRFEMPVDGQMVFLEYELRDDTIVFLHAETPPALRGRGLAGQLTRAALESARERGLRVVPLCGFVRSYMRQHPELAGPVAT